MIHKVFTHTVFTHTVSLLILCCAFGFFTQAGWSQTLVHSELPEADLLPLPLVPPSLAEVYPPAEIPQLLACSPDNKTLACSTNHNTYQQSPFGGVWARLLERNMERCSKLVHNASHVTLLFRCYADQYPLHDPSATAAFDVWRSPLAWCGAVPCVGSRHLS